MMLKTAGSWNKKPHTRCLLVSILRFTRRTWEEVSVYKLSTHAWAFLQRDIQNLWKTCTLKPQISSVLIREKMDNNTLWSILCHSHAAFGTDMQLSELQSTGMMTITALLLSAVFQTIQIIHFHLNILDSSPRNFWDWKTLVMIWRWPKSFGLTSKEASLVEWLWACIWALLITACKNTLENSERPLKSSKLRKQNEQAKNEESSPSS